MLRPHSCYLYCKEREAVPLDAKYVPRCKEEQPNKWHQVVFQRSTSVHKWELQTILDLVVISSSSSYSVFIPDKCLTYKEIIRLFFPPREKSHLSTVHCTHHIRRNRDRHYKIEVLPLTDVTAWNVSVL